MRNIILLFLIINLSGCFLFRNVHNNESESNFNKIDLPADTVFINEMDSATRAIFYKYIIGLSDAYKEIDKLKSENHKCEGERNSYKSKVEELKYIIEVLKKTQAKKVKIIYSKNTYQINEILAKLDSCNNVILDLSGENKILKKEINKDNSKVKTDNSTKVKTSKSIWMYSTIFLLLVIVSYIVFKRLKTNKA